MRLEPGAGGGTADSVEKNLRDLAVVACHPFEAFGTVHVPPALGIEVALGGAGFGCALGCGACCCAFTLDWVPAEFDRVRALYPEVAGLARPREVVANGRVGVVWTITNEVGEAQESVGRLFCRLLDLERGACTIHAANPWSCRVELLKLRRRRLEDGGMGYIEKGPYKKASEMVPLSGQVGELGCTFPPYAVEQVIENDLPVLRRLDVWASLWGIQTWLPAVISGIEDAVAVGRVPDFHVGG